MKQITGPSVSSVKVDRLGTTVEHSSSLRWTRLSVGALTRLINTPNRSGATCEASDSKPVQKRESRLRFVQNNRVSRDTRQKERERKSRKREERGTCALYGFPASGPRVSFARVSLKFPRSTRTYLVLVPISSFTSFRTCARFSDSFRLLPVQPSTGRP